VREHCRINLKLLSIGFVILGLALAIALVVFGAKMAPKLRDQFWIEIAKAGAQLGIISIIGGGIALALRLLESLRQEDRAHLESRREERRILNEYRLNVLRDVTTSYNRIKAVRRTLRAFGFRAPASPLTPDQVTEFRSQMKSLNEAQLALERLKREVKVQSDSFCEAEQIRQELETAEKYINHVIEDWEQHAVNVVAGAVPTVITSMRSLQDFLDKPQKGFGKGAADPIESVQNRIRSQTLGKSAATNRPLAAATKGMGRPP
jgi:hypothetical protein